MGSGEKADGSAQPILPQVSLITPNLPEAAALLAAPHARTEKEMLEQGIEVPGYSLPAKSGGKSSGRNELAVRFQALQEHLK